jgi:uroporphyrinogen-III synthase
MRFKDKGHTAKGLLSQRKILLTRPQHQVQELGDLISQFGGIPILFPSLHILPPQNMELLKEAIKNLSAFAIAIFTSVNAVTHAAPLIKNVWPEFPKKLKIVSIGEGTAKALVQEGLPHHYLPQGRFNSENLLKLPFLQKIAKKNIVIFTGLGGRDLLAHTLSLRGAKVHLAIAYRRVIPTYTKTMVLKIWRKKNIDIIVCTSNEALQNLVNILAPYGKKDLLLKTPLLLGSERQEVFAKILGFAFKPVIAENVTNEAIITSLKQWETPNEPTKP